MGYRSQIGAVFSVDEWSGNDAQDENAPQWTKYKEMVGLIKLSKFYELMNQSTEDKNCIGWHWGEFYFNAENWKWYPDYDIVQAWEELWGQMQSIEGISGYFGRVGEEVDDIVQETFGDCPDYEAFYACSSLVCEVDNAVFGNGDIDAEITNNVSKTKGETICMDNNATQV